jgi:DNA polymerase-3 subunit alpha
VNIPIHNHSEYSALDGLASMQEIAERCVEIGCPCCGLTDHGTVAGHLEFAKVLTEYDIKPIFGCELYHGVKTEFGKNERDQAHFVAGALNDEGLRNLWRLVDFASTNFRYVGRVNWDALEKHSEGMWATSACIQGLIPQQLIEDDYDALNRYLNIYGDNFYMELHTYSSPDVQRLNEYLVEIAEQRGVPVVYADDAHRAAREDFPVFDAYVAMSTGDSIWTPDDERKMVHPEDSLYIKDEAEIREALSYLPDSVVDEAIRNSAELADRCNAQLPEIRRHLPVFVPSDCPWIREDDPDDTAELFTTLVQEGIVNRYGEDASEEIWDRAMQEVEVFLNAGLEHYFLLAWDVCKFCDENGILRGPGRGSAGGCIVAYALGITDVDPLKYGLIFERFFNAGREDGYPDIDTDFSKERREEVRSYLAKRWGEDRVRSIGTIARMKPVEALNKTARVCGIKPTELADIKKIVKTVPDINILGHEDIGWDDTFEPDKTIYVWKHVGDEITEFISKQTEDRQEVLYTWLALVEQVCSRVDGYGIHASGIVVSDVDLPDETPCFWSANKKLQATQFPMDAIDKRKFIKLDVLGLRNLDTLAEWEKRCGKVEWSGLEGEEHPEEMWQMLDRGLSLGIFQIEDGYAKRLAKDFQPRSVEDLAIIVSLNRPGPIRSGAPDSFIARRAGLEEVTYDHPILEDILHETYGWFLYQEQVIAFFNKLGYNLSEADAVRKILGKKKPVAMRALRDGEGEWEGRGYFDMAEAAGIDSKTAHKIWGKLEDFAKYSFNKSHAIAYGTIAFRTLYAKYHDPTAFLIGLIKTNPDDAGKYVAEARRMGIEVLPPDVEYSEPDIENINGKVYFGIANVKGIGKAAATLLCKLRQEYDVSSPEAVADALDQETVLYKEKQTAAKEAGKAFKAKSPRTILKANQLEALFNSGGWDRLGERDVTLETVKKHEEELLGVVITDNAHEVLMQYEEDFAECDLYNDANKPYEGEELRLVLPGIISMVRETKTRAKGEKMGIVTIEYEGDEAEFVVFPRQWKSFKFLWKERTPAVLTLRRTEKGLNFDEGRLLK